MTKTEFSPSPRGKESHAIFTTLLALLLIALCLWASHWQYSRGVARHHRNFIIASHVDQPITTLDAIGSDVAKTFLDSTPSLFFLFRRAGDAGRK